MKRILLSLFLLWSILDCSFAQNDQIVPRKGKKFQCYISAITTDSVYYSMVDGGNVYAIGRHDIKAFTSADFKHITLGDIEDFCKVHYPNNDYYFITVYSTSKGRFSGVKNIQINYGQGPNVDQVFYFEEGKEMKFESMEEAINSLSGYGWKYVEAFFVPLSENHDFMVLFKKKNEL